MQHVAAGERRGREWHRDGIGVLKQCQMRKAPMPGRSAIVDRLYFEKSCCAEPDQIGDDFLERILPDRAVGPAPQNRTTRGAASYEREGLGKLSAVLLPVRHRVRPEATNILV
jgi:hypothetical protein